MRVVAITTAGPSGADTSSSVISSTAVRDSWTRSRYVTDPITLDVCAWAVPISAATRPTVRQTLETMALQAIFSGLYGGTVNRQICDRLVSP